MDAREVISVFSDEELQNDTSFFDASQWINKGRRFQDAPPHVQLAYERLFIPPVPVYKLLPFTDESPTTLILMNLPQWDESLDETDTPAQLTFSSSKPTSTPSSIDDILSMHLLPIRSIHRLRGTLGQAWLDGKESICDQRTGEVHWPFWMLTVFSCLRDACRARSTWLASFRWLDAVQSDETTSMAAFALNCRARELTSRIAGWSGHITARGLDDVYLEHVADILGDKMLRSGIVDALIDGISDELDSRYGTQRELLVAGTNFSTHISDAAYNDPSDGGAKLLQKYVTLFQPGSPHRSLCFSLHCPPLHFAAGFIDFHTGKVQFGDPLAFPRPKRFFKNLPIWLKRNFPAMIVQITDDLPCAVQRDSFNCPIISANTVAHKAPGSEIWVEERAIEARLEAFCRIVERILDSQKVSTSHSLENEVTDIIL